MLKRLLPKTLRKALARAIAPLDEVRIAQLALAPLGRGNLMIDVGAHHGSSCLPFAEDGVTVHAFEPDSINRRVLVSNCRGLPNVVVNAVAVSDQVRAEVPFFSSPVSTGISGLSAFEKHHSESELVETTTLEKYLAEHRIDSVDFLKIDTEGFDLFVLRGFPWGQCQPRVIVCEFEDRKTQPLGYSYRELIDLLTQSGYSVLVSEWNPISRYGIAHRWRRFNWNVLEPVDPMGWGNLIAVRSDEGELWEKLQLVARQQARKEKLRQMVHSIFSRG